MSDDSPLFAVSQYTTLPLTFEEDVNLYTSLGVPCIEVCEEKLSGDPAEARDQLALLAESCLRVTSVQPRVHSPFPHKGTAQGDPVAPADRMARFRQTIDLFADAFPGQNIPLVAGGGVPPGYDFRLAHRTARECFHALAEYAAERGLSIAFEHLNPVLMNLYTFICTFDEAIRLINDVGHPNFGFFLDLWHVWHERHIVDRVADLHDLILGVHVSDWPADGPRHYSDRLLPGDGIIDLPPLLAAAERAGYTGAYCVEIFSDTDLPDSLLKDDPANVIERARQGLARAWKARPPGSGSPQSGVPDPFSQ